MIDAARERLGPRRGPARAATCSSSSSSEPVDAILSTATFHWIADHDRLFRRLRAALRPGGRLVAQCGGEGNIDDPARDGRRGAAHTNPTPAHFSDWRAPWNYAGAEQTQERLLAAGFAAAECWLQAAPRQPEQPREFLSTIVLGPHVQQLPAELREPFMDERARACSASPSSSTTCA